MNHPHSIVLVRIFDAARQYCAALADVERELDSRRSRLAAGSSLPSSNMGVGLTFAAAIADRHSAQLLTLVDLAREQGATEEDVTAALSATSPADLMALVGL